MSVKQNNLKTWFKSGTPWIWMNAGAVSIAVIMTLGLLMVAEFFCRAGWEVSGGPLDTGHDPVKAVARDWFDVVGFSLACETGIERLSETMSQVRKKSLNPGVSIIAGGAIFGLHPEFGPQIPADAIITDGPAAPALAEKLLADRLARIQV